MSEIRVDGDALARYELAGWRERFDLVAGVTGGDTDFRLTLRTLEAAEDPVERLARLPAILNGFGGVAASRQRHGTAIAVHEEPGARVRLADGFDGHLTRRTGLLLALTVADCVPVYLAHPPTGTVALLHAGWRGTAAGILEQGIQAVCDLAVTSPAGIVMHCGVGICGACYEVGPEVLMAVVGSGGGSPGRLDLPGALTNRAAAAGLKEITVSGWCTVHDHDRFHSYRHSGGGDGRMVAYLGRPVA